MKKSVGALRLDLAQYREMQIFAQFGSGLDEHTKRQLTYGEGLMRLLRQPNRTSLSLWQQVVLLLVAQDGMFMNIPVRQIDRVKSDFLTWFGNMHSTLTLRIEHEKLYSDELKDLVIEASRNFFQTVKP